MAMIEQTQIFKAPVTDVYTAIADADTHAAFTGAPVTMGTEVGMAFTTHGGAIQGRILELVAGERIVHAWRPADWPAGVYSIVRYEFAADGEATVLTLTHDAIPEGSAEQLAGGWNQMYWTPLASYLTG